MSGGQEFAGVAGAVGHAAIAFIDANIACLAERFKFLKQGFKR
ncbi:hypothetical protein [Massilia niastensis]|nr:hypothetical protein [Massilia niastensis]